MMQMGMNGGHSNPRLPQDLITAILVRLPVKSLIRFQCVCKEWKSLFKTQSFITQHLLHSSLHNPFLFFESYRYSRPYRAYLLNTDMQIVPLHNHPLTHPNSYLRANSLYCNGLLCLHLCDGTGYVYFSLWNPATREMSIISKNYDCVRWSIEVGFGFSEIVNDYKVVKICHSRRQDMVTKVEVYSLNVGTWKEVELGKLDGVIILPPGQGLALNGAIFWIGLDKHNRNIIVSFDVAIEAFTLIPMPPLPSSKYDRCLTVYENKLAILTHTLSQDFKSSSIHLWVMEKEGTSLSNERCCWTKKYTSNRYRGYFLYPMSIWKNEIFCNVDELPVPVGQDEDEDVDEAEPNGERKIVMFNFTMNEFRICDFPQFVRGYDSFVYVESLVPLSNIHIEHV